MKKFAILLILPFVAACTDANGAKRILESQGYTNVQITGYSFFGCSEDDTIRTGFKATGANGKPVQGTVCGGILFKNSTIRVE